MSPAQRCTALRCEEDCVRAGHDDAMGIARDESAWGRAYLDGLEEWHIRIVRLERHHIL